MFQTFGNAGLEKLLTAARSFASDFQRLNHKPRWLSLLGSSGAGKTMLAKIVLSEARAFAQRSPYVIQTAIEQRVRRVKFGTWPKMAKRLRQGDYDIMDEFKTAWLAIVDDIGAEHDAKSGFIPAELYDLLNERLGRWTLFTSNLSMDEIAEQIDGRIASRLRRDGSTVVEVQVPDFATRRL